MSILEKSGIQLLISDEIALLGNFEDPANIAKLIFQEFLFKHCSAQPFCADQSRPIISNTTRMIRTTPMIPIPP